MDKNSLDEQVGQVGFKVMNFGPVQNRKFDLALFEKIALYFIPAIGAWISV
jgi:hypothetical protein